VAGLFEPTDTIGKLVPGVIGNFIKPDKRRSGSVDLQVKVNQRFGHRSPLDYSHFCEVGKRNYRWVSFRRGRTIGTVAWLARHAEGKDIEASGGIKDPFSAIAMLSAGTTLRGTSSGVSIVGGGCSTAAY
jgi:hypothetical protein